MAKRKGSLAPLVFFGLGTAALLWANKAKARPRSASSTSDGSGRPPMPPSSGVSTSPLSEYIRYLYKLQELMLPAYRAYWTEAKLKAVARAAAAHYKVPPSIVWGVMYGESKWRPVGLGFLGNLAKNLKYGGTDYGLGQMYLGRFQNEKSLNPSRFPWKHHQLLDPRVAIWSIAASYRRMYEKKGENPSWETIGTWWAGTGKTQSQTYEYKWQRKAAQIQQYGGQVNEGGRAGVLASDVVMPK